MRKDIQHRLDQSQITCIDEIFSDVHHIMIDGYWLPKMKDENGVIIKKILLLYYDYRHEKVIWFSIRDGERKEYIVEDLTFLRDQMKYSEIRSCTCDGWIAILASLKEVFPKIIIQRCLVHIQRQVRVYISKKPKSPAGKDLAGLSRKEILFHPEHFLSLWNDWKQKHQFYLNEKTKKEAGGWRYTHTRLRNAVRHIENALPYMFQTHTHHLREIALTSNRIEGYFWVLAEEWIKEYKGLSPSRLHSFVALWIYLRNQK